MNSARIYDAAMAAIRRNGITATQTGELAVRLKISKRTLYEICGDKSTLLRRCMRRESERECRWLEKIVRSYSGSPLRQIVRIYLHTIRYVHSFNPAFFGELASESYFRIVLTGYRRHLGRIYNELLDRCRRMDLFIPDCDLTTLTDFLCQRFTELSSGAVALDRTAPELSGFIVRSVLKGNCTAKGKACLL